MRKKVSGIAALLVCTVIWGFAFIAQSVGMDAIGPFTFQTIRSALAVAFLVPVSFLLDESKCSFRQSLGRWMDKKLWRSGFFCGIALFVASSLQQVGLVETDAGKAGFLTAMYIVLVPILGLFLGKKPPKTAGIGVLLAVVGLYLLSCTGPGGIQRGDVLMIACAFAFAVQITLVDRLSPGMDGFRMNCIQCLTVSVLSLPWMFLTETPSLSAITACWLPLGFAGVLSMGVAYSLQIVGQKHVEPTAASLIMSLESTFAALGGWWLLGERMTAQELAGCALVFGAVVLSQLPGKRKKTLG